MLDLQIDGKRLIPVRLIPFITGWKFPPDSLVRILSGRDGFNRVYLQSFHLQPDGNYQLITPKEWDTCLADLEILTNKLKAVERVEDENYPIWRIESIKTLPRATFAWLDELESVWNSAYSTRTMHLPNERAGDRELNLSPLIPSNAAKFIYEGFENLLIPIKPSLDNPQNTMTCFSEFHHILMIDPFYGVGSAATESILNNIYRQNAVNILFQNFRTRFSQSPCKADIHRHLIYLWCGLMGLPGYSGNQTLDWHSEEFLEHWTNNFDLRLDELREFLRKHELPLPSRFFPDDVDNTERRLALDESAYQSAFHDFAIILPQLREDLEELRAIQPESMDARQRKKDEIEQIKRRIDVIMTGSPGETSQSSTSTRNTELQIAANELAEQMKKGNHRNITKRDIAMKLAKSGQWPGMTESRIERLISKKW